MVSNYEDIFSYEKIEQNLKVLRLLCGTHGHLIVIPFFVYAKNGTKRSNAKFFEVLKQHSSGLTMFFVYSEITKNMNHAIGACINHDIKQIHLYDSNGENGSYYFQHGLTSNMDGSNFLIKKNNSHVYSPCSNMIYQITFKYIKPHYPDYSTTVHMDNRLNPRFCVRSSPLGMCALWSFIYIVLRSYGVSDYNAPFVMHQISESAFIAENEFDLVYLISALLENRSQPKFENLENYMEGLEETKNSIIRRFKEKVVLPI
jgi:hypothetical protein